MERIFSRKRAAMVEGVLYVLMGLALMTRPALNHRLCLRQIVVGIGTTAKGCKMMTLAAFH